jgi:hypothetical protein
MYAMTRNITNILNLFGSFAASVTTYTSEYHPERRFHEHLQEPMSIPYNEIPETCELLPCSEFVNCASGNDKVETAH